MAQLIQLKRSAVAGRVPTTANLALGELAINVRDGKLYFQRDDSTIQTILTTNSTVTGDVNLVGTVTATAFVGDGSGLTGIAVSPTLQEVTDNGASTTNGITVASLTTAGPVEGSLFRDADDNNYFVNPSGATSAVLSGNVGIGVGSPAAKLEVSGDILISGGSNQISFYSSSQTGYRLYRNSTTMILRSDGNIKEDAGSNYIISTDSTERLRINSTGNVGIGTTSPTTKLHVLDDNPYALSLQSDTTTRWRMGVGNAGYYQGWFILNSSADGDMLRFSSAALNVLKNVRVDISDNSTTLSTGGSSLRLANTNTTINNISAIDFPQTSGGAGFSRIGVIYKDRTSSSEDQDMFFRTIGGGSSAEVMRLTSDGNVGIGTDSPGSPLEVYGSGSTVLDIQGSQGQLFSVSDSLTGSLMSVNDISGLPILEVFDNDKVVMGEYGNNTLVVNGDKVGIGTGTPSVKLHVSDATAPSFRLSRTGTGQIWEQGIDSSGRFQLKEAASEGGTQYTRFQVDDSGEVQFGAYGSGTITGTPTYALAVDANGNIIENAVQSTPTGGSGTSGYVTKWTATDTVGNSVIYDNGSNVGIGTTSPASLLQVEGSANNVAIFKSTDNRGSIAVQDDDTTAYVIAEGGRASLGINNGLNANNLNINGSGNVGIGTIQPLAKLDVQVPNNTVGIQVTNADGNTVAKLRSAGTPGRGELYLDNDGTTNVFFGALGNSYINAGNVGIGTTSPTYKLDVAGDIIARDTYPSIYLDHSGTVLGGIRADATTKLELKTLTTAPLSFQVNSSEKMRITSDGNVGINVTNPTEKLTVNGKIKFYEYGGAHLTNQASSTYRFESLVTDSAATAGSSIGSYIKLTAAATSSTGRFSDFRSRAYAENTINNTDWLINYYAELRNYTSTNAVNLSHHAGLYVHSLGVGGSATVTNNYGAYLDVGTNATNNYGIYQVGTGVKNHFAGSVGIGTTSPTHKLQVAGTFKSVGINDSSSAQAIFINGNGEVGIGVTNQTAALDVGGVFQFSTSTDLLQINNNTNTGGINLSGANSRIYFGGHRAIEGNQGGSTLTFGEGYSNVQVHSNATFVVNGNQTLGGNLTVSGRADFQKDLRLRGSDSTGNLGVVRMSVDANNALTIDAGNDGNNRVLISEAGDLTVPGTITAQEFRAEFITNTIILESGSTQFGDSADDTHEFTGKIGLNYDNPDYTLDIRKETNNNDDTIVNIRANWANTSTDKRIGSLYFTAYDADVDSGAWKNAAGIRARAENEWTAQSNSNAYLAFHTLGANSFGERMRITSGGNVGIGASVPDGRLDVRGTFGRWRVNGYGGMYFRNDSDTGYTRYIHPRSNGTLSFGRIADTDLSSSGVNIYATTAYDQFYIDASGTAYFNGGINWPGVNGENFVINTDGQRIIWEHQRNGLRRMTFYHETDQDVFNFNFESGNELQINGNRIVTVNELGTAASSAATDFVSVTGDTMTGTLRIESATDANRFSYLANSRLVLSRAVDGSEVHQIKPDSSNDNNLIIATRSRISFKHNAESVTSMTLIDNGNVGVGTTNMYARFNVRATAHNNGISVNRQADNTAALYIGNDGGNNPILAANNADMLFGRDLSGTFTERMRLTNTGSLGIGTTSPEERLHVIGDIRFGGATSGDWAVFQHGTKSIQLTQSNAGSGGHQMRFRTPGWSTDAFIYTNGNTERFRITGTGNVGIGTASPSSKLHVVGDSVGTTNGDEVTLANIRGARHNLEFKHLRTADATDWNSTTYRLQNKVDSTNMQSIDFTTDASFNRHIDINTASNAFNTRFTHNGRVGIGTTNPADRLSVQDGAITSTDASGVNYAKIDRFSGVTLAGNGTGSRGVQTPNTDALTFGTNATERMRITSAGNIGIGTTSPNSWAQLETTGTVAVGGILYVKSSQKIQGLTAFPGGAGNLSINPDGGNVGIGTTNPTQKLTVNGTIRGTGSTARLTLDNTSGQVFQIYAWGSGTNIYNSATSNADIWFGRDATVANNFYFTRNGTNHTMKVDTANERVGIGTMSPSSALHVKGVTTVEDTAKVYQTGREVDGSPSGTSMIALDGNLYVGAFIDYTIFDSGKTNMRSGTIQVVFDGIGNAQFTDNSTLDIGNTVPAEFNVDPSGAPITRVLFVAPDPDWSVRYHVRYL